MSYFSRVTLKAGRVKPEQLVGLACGDGYKEHQALWRLFANDPDAERDFLFRRDELYHGLRYFVVSQREPDDADGIWLVESKPYAPSVHVGQQFAFSLRANPVIKRKGDDGKSRRHDVVMDARHRRGHQSQAHAEREPVIAIAQKAGVEWLQQRAAKHGFSIDEGGVCVEGYRQHRSPKRGKQISYSSIDLTGVLRVEDSAVFTEVLGLGIGPAKAFGCGLLLIRRV